MHEQRLVWVTALAAALASPALLAAEIYKWVGKDGVTHYSESAPASESPAVETLETTDSEAPAEAAPGYRSALEVAKEIEAGRLERERLRLERQKLRQEQAQAAAADQRQDADSNRYYPVYPYYRHYPRRYPRPPMHPRHGPRPAPYIDPHQNYAPRGGINARMPGMSGR